MRGSGVRVNAKRRAKYGWAAIGAFVLAFNVTAKDGGMLSEQMDDWRRDHPVLVVAVVAAIALHLTRTVPTRYDPVSTGFGGIRKLKGNSDYLYRRSNDRIRGVQPPGVSR